MIFQLLWALIGFFSILGYLILWIQQWRDNHNPVNSRYANPSPKDSRTIDENPPKEKPHEISKIPEAQVTEFDTDTTEELPVDTADNYVLDLDELDNEGSNEPKLRYRRSFISDPESLDPTLLEMEDDDDSLCRRNISLKSRYYTICNLNCERNTVFLKAPENTPVSIEDADNLDYWITEDLHSPSLISVIPRCCLTSSLERYSQGSTVYSREVDKNDNSNTVKESEMKRKSAIKDLIAYDREYCANLNLSKDIVTSFLKTESQFCKEVMKSFSSLQNTLSQMVEIHEKNISPELSTCEENPSNIASVLLKEKHNLMLYTTFYNHWKLLKSEVIKLSSKNIMLKNDSSRDNYKISITSFLEIMTMIETNLFQYSTFLCDIMRYSGRVGGDVYDIQKAIIMLGRIRRMQYDVDFIESIIDDKSKHLKGERIVRMTKTVTISEPEMIKRSGDILKLVKENVYDLLLLKTSLVIIERRDSNVSIYKFIKINTIKIFERENDKDPIIILFSQKPDGDYQIFIFHFKSMISKKTWLYEIKRRLSKFGNHSLFVSNDDYKSQYDIFLHKNQRLVATEIETVYLETATIDAACTTLGSDFFEKTLPSIENINFENATMDIRKSITPFTNKSMTDIRDAEYDQVIHPIIDIYEDYLPIKNDIVAPNTNDVVEKEISIESFMSSIDVDINSWIEWPLEFYNFNPQCHNVSWTFCGTILNMSDPDVIMKVTEDCEKVNKCQFSLKMNSAFQSGELQCKITNEFDKSKVKSALLKVHIVPLIIHLGILPLAVEVHGNPNNSIIITWKIIEQSSEDFDLNYLVCFKDGNKVTIDNVLNRFSLNFNEKTVILEILKSNKESEGVYTIESADVSKLLIKENSSIHVIVDLEANKKNTFRAANQEDVRLSESTDILSGKTGEIISGFSEEGDSIDAVQPLITTMKVNYPVLPIMVLKNKFIIIDEFEDAEIVVEISKKLENNLKWYHNGNVLKTKELEHCVYDHDAGCVRLILKKCDRNKSGIYKCVAINPYNKKEESVEIELQVSPQVITAFLTCDVEEIDLISGNTLSVTMDSVGVDESALKNGCWLLNFKPLDLERLGGEIKVRENLVMLYIPNVLPDIQGSLQFKLDKPKTLYSPEIQIKIRDLDKTITNSTISQLKLKAVRDYVEVMENEDLLLEAQILSGNVSLYEIPSWTLNDYNVTNPNVKIDLDSKVCKCMIPTSRLEDKGNYNCTFRPKAGNTGEVVKVSFKVNVKISSKECLSGSIIKTKSSIIEVNEANKAVLEVELLTPIVATPHWLLNEKMLTDNDKLHISYFPELKVSKLVISSCHKSDEGLYRCVIVNPDTNVEESVDIDVKIVRKQVAGSLDIDVEEIDLMSGEMLTVNVHCVGIERFLLLNGCWYLNSKPLDLNKYHGEFIVDNESVVLHIPNVSFEIRGTLQFKIDKPMMLCSPEVMIKVRENTKKLIKTTTSALKLKEIRPCVELIENEELRLEVEIVSGDTSFYEYPQWTLNDSKNLCQKGKVTFDSKTCKLCISAIKSEDGGDYKCCFNPKEGAASDTVIATFRVEVKQENSKYPNEKTKEKISQAIATKTSQIEVIADADAVLEAEILLPVNGTPKWQVNEKTLKNSNNIDISFLPETKISKLVLKKCQKAQEGVYRCVVVNSGDNSENYIDINLKIIYQQKSGFLDCDIEEIDLKSGEALKLTLDSVSINESILKSGCWYLNSKPLDLQKFHGTFETTVDAIILHIPNVSKDIRGSLQFKIDKPRKLCSPEIEIKVRDVEKKSVSFSSNDLKLKAVKSRLEVEENEPLTLDVEIVSGNVMMYETPQWMLNEKNSLNSSSKMFQDNNHYKLFIPVCELSDTGCYKCVMVGKTGTNVEAAMAQFTVLINPITRALSTQFSTMKTFEGESVALCVEIEGFDERDIKWNVASSGDYFHSNQITDRIITTCCNNVALCHIDKVAKDDSGKYICKGFVKEKLLSECEILLTVISNDNNRSLIHFEKNLFVVLNGADAELKVLVDCSSAQYSVHWYFNYRLFEMNDGVMSDITDNGRFAELKLNKCSKERAGLYHCTIEHTDGYTSTTKTKLQVVDEQRFISVNEGDLLNIDITLEKNFENRLILWSKNGVMIDKLEGFSERKEGDKNYFYKDKAIINDNGVYMLTCYENSLIKKQIELTVTVFPRHYPENEKKFKLVCDKTEILASETDSLIISVEVFNWKEATIQWFLNGVPFFDSYTLDGQFIDLYIESPTAELHTGVFRCQVTTVDEEVEIVDVTVKFEDCPINNSSMNAFDLLSCTVEEVDIVEGYPLQLSVECRENTQTLSRPLWYKNDCLVDVKDERINIMQQSNSYNLIVKNTKLSDRGLYCVKVGGNSVEIDVKVRSNPTKAKVNEKRKGVIEPKIVLSLADVELESEPQIVTFEFQIQKDCQAEAVWYFEDDQIEVNNSEFIQRVNENSYTLTIPNAYEKHCGKYSIKVSNDKGTVRSDARLSLFMKAKVISLTQQTPTCISAPCCIAPMFTKKLKSTDLSSGDTLHLNCRVISEPAPNVVWTKNGATIDGTDSTNNIKLVNDDPDYSLTISNICFKDAAQYCCTASNSLGCDTTEALVTVDGYDFEDCEEPELAMFNSQALSESNAGILSEPLLKPVLQIVSQDSNTISLSWTFLSNDNNSKITYSIERQRHSKPNQWKSIKSEIIETFCTLSCSEFPRTEKHNIRCMVSSSGGYEAVSNVVVVSIGAGAPTMPTLKPVISMRDASCATISWQRGKCDNLTEEESIGKIHYCLEMKDSAKGTWRNVNNEIIENQYLLHLEPGVSYMFRVSAFNDHGITEPSQSSVIRIDRLKFVPDFSLDAPWLHMNGQPCLKWRAASVPEFCDDCVPGIMPEYKVEYRSGRLSPWKVYQENIYDCQTPLTSDVVNSAQELRVSCRNKFGQNGPTRIYRIQSNVVYNHDSQNINQIMTVINTEIVKKLAIETIAPNGLALYWEPWTDDKEYSYIFQKKSSYSHDWTKLESTICGEHGFLELNIAENYSKQLRILAIEDEGRSLYNSHNWLTLPFKEQLVPTAPENLKVAIKIHSHELTWTGSKNHNLVDLPITYVIQYKIITNLWVTIADQIGECAYTNEKTGELGVIFYRISARNSFGASDFSNEIQVNAPLNGLGMDQIIKSIRYFVIDCEKINIKWQLCDVIFENGLNVDDLSFNVEKKSAVETMDWYTVGSCAGRCSLLVASTFEEENLFRIQPLLDGERLTASKVFRIYLTKELLIPDMSFTKPDIITDSIKDYFIEWVEPSIECGFSPEGLEICSIAVMLTDLQYELQYYIAETTTTRRIRTKDIKPSQWMTIKDDIKGNNYYWENIDPTKEYVFRVIPRNQFGEGQPSRVAKLRPQITIPDFSLVRLNIEDQSLGNKSRENDTSLSWTSPKVNPERYTPYSVDVQYRQKGSNINQDWKTLKSNIKNSRVSINELDDQIDYEIRVVPVTEFGLGKPSMTSRKPKRHDNSVHNDPVAEIKPETVIEDVYVSLSNDTELTFNKTYGMEKEGLVWRKDNNPLNISEEKVKVFSTYKGVIGLLISNIKEDDIGAYSVLSKTGDLIQCMRLVKSDAPTFLNPPINRSVNLHDNVLIAFKIDAQPPPTVTWRKNWKKIFSTYRTNITEDKDNQKYSIKISKGILSDSGEYCIRAENAVGFVDVKFNLRIDPQPEMRTIQCYDGDVNDRYYIVKQISKGAYSSCQLIVEKLSHKEFAGKVFGVNNIGIGKTEFESIKNIRQRNIVELFDAILNSTEYLILVYERLEGLLLVDYMSNLSHWNEQSAQLLIYQLLQATSYLHAFGIAHLDIQPCNIMVTGKLLDTIKLFGFSNATKEDALETHRHQFSISPFSAPELLKGDLISLKCDVWSVGIISLICLLGHLSVDIRSGHLIIEDGKGLLSEVASDFVVGCLDSDNLNRLSSLEALRHEWFMNPIIDCNASLDHLKDDMVRIMTYPEEMILHFPNDIESAIKKILSTPRPTLTVDSVPSSPSPSQFSSRASSVSRDGINYERCDQIDEPISEASITYGLINENFQPVDDKYVPNSAKDLIFTVPLKDQTIKPSPFATSKNIVNLTCQLTLPVTDQVSISWYKNQELLSDSTKIKLEILTGSFLSCTLENPGELDVGIYRCVARSRSMRAETSARLLVGDVPLQPGQPTVLFVEEDDVLLNWSPDLTATDDIIYRVDIKEINGINVSNAWRTVGYSVDNRYLIENMDNHVYIARVVAQNKYGFSSYSIASAAFKNQGVNLESRKKILNKEWMISSRQSKDSNNLHDLIKDISSAEITLDIINEYYNNNDEGISGVKVLMLNKIKGNYPSCLIQRDLTMTEKSPAIDLCLRIKYDHLPIVYGVINEPTMNLRYSIEEFVPGGNLISVLLARTLYSEFTVVTILRQLIETIQFLHSNNIRHGNINPSNILIARRTNQLYDIKLIGLHNCQMLGVVGDVENLDFNVPSLLSTFQAPEFRYEGITTNESDIWSVGTLSFLLLTGHLPTIEDISTESEVQCSTKNTNTLHLPTKHAHFRTPDLSLLAKFSKGARKFVYNTLKKNPRERGNADYWLAHSWFRQDMATIAEMQTKQISAVPLVEFLTSPD